MTFAPAEEIEQFGKRRKLNDKDRIRLSNASGGQPLSGLKHRETIADWNANLQRAKICIDGRPVGIHSSNSQEMSTNQVSSQPMLLDHEEPVSAHTSYLAKDSWTRSPNRPANFDRGPPSIERTLSPSPDASTNKGPGTVHNTAGLASGGEFANPSPERDVVLFYERSVTQSPVPFDSPLPRWRHSPIEHQAFAEKSDFAQSYTRHPNHGPPFRPVQFLSASPRLLNTDASSYPTASSWLRRPRRTNASSSPNTGRSQALLQRSAATVSPEPNLPANLSLGVAEIKHRSPMARVFGQLIQIRSDDGGDCQ